MRPILGIIGAGKVGSTLARLWYDNGYEVRAVFSRTAQHAHMLAEKVGATVATSPRGVVARVDLILLSIPDDAIEEIVADLVPITGEGKAIIHTSGVYGADVLVPFASAGMVTGSLHPIFPFADMNIPLQSFKGTTFAVEAADPGLHQWLIEMVEVLGGRVLDLPAGAKALYHAALVIAGNYTVTLYAVAEQILMSLGAERGVVDEALNGLFVGVANNLQANGIPAALTGPLTRADLGTLGRHLASLRSYDSALADMYIALARLSYPMLGARGVDTTLIENYLKQDIKL